MKRPQIALLRQLAANDAQICRSCRQVRQLHRTLRQSAPAAEKQSDAVPAQAIPPLPKTLPKATSPPIAKPDLTNPDDIERGQKFVPKTLVRPIGFAYPPLPTDNVPHDMRTLKERRDDFVNFDKHLEKRKRMTSELARPYFRDFMNMRYEKGKIFRSNERLWNSAASLWFPNIWGWDLKQGNQEYCTSEVIGQSGRGKVTVVGMFSRTWAENQVKTFVDDEVRKLIEENADVAQMLEINVEDTKLSRSIIWLFASSLRASKKADWQQYMVVKEIPENVRETLGILNKKAGSVFLLDADSKIRWAGSGDAWPGERDAFYNGLNRLIQKTRAEPPSGRSQAEIRNGQAPKAAAAA